jgi:outer membrane protein TolC
MKEKIHMIQKFALTFILSLGILGLLSHLSFAQGNSTLQLDQALKEAQAQSPELQMRAAETDASDWGKVENFAGFLPHFNVDATHYFNIKYQVLDVSLGGGPKTPFPFVSPATTYGLYANWNIFNGFQDTDKYGAAKLKSDAAHSDLEWTKFQINQEVRMNFFQSIASRSLEAVAQENVSNLEQHLKQIQDMLRVGEAIEVDVIRVQVQLNTARTDKLNSHDNVIISQQHLAQSLGKSTEARLPEGALPIPEDSIATRIDQMSRDEAEKFAHRGDIQATNLRAEAASKTESAAGHYWIPAVALVGNYQLYNNEDFSVTNSNSFRSAYEYGVELTWNIFDGMLSYARSKEAAAMTVQAAKSEALARIQASTDVQVNQNTYRVNLSQYVTDTDNLERSKRSVQLALAGLRSGTQTNTDVLDAELDLFKARAGVIQSQMNALEAQIKFENAIGRTL